MNAPLPKLAPQAEELVQQAAALIASGADPAAVARVIYSLAYMDGALGMAQAHTKQIVDAAMRGAL